MNACEANEIALERMAAGDLPEDEVAQLEAHLAGCSTCQRYQQQMERMQAMIQTSNATVDAARTWQRVNKYVVRREEKANRQLTRYIPIGMVSMTIVLIVSLIDGRPSAALFAGGALVAWVAQIVLMLARQRKLRQLVDSPRDVLTIVRRELSLKQLFAGSGVLFAVLLGVIWVGTGLGRGLLRLRPLPPRRDPATTAPPERRLRVGSRRTSSMNGLTEETLLERFRDGDAAQREVVFNEIHRRLGRGLEIVCRRMLGNPADAEDALQEVFLSLHQGLPRFRGAARLSTWAYRIAVRASLHRKARAHRAAEESLDFDPARKPNDAAQEKELARALDRAVASLRPRYRTVFSLCCIDELSQKDVARILGIPEGTVWTHLHRARKELAAKMKGWL